MRANKTDDVKDEMDRRDEDEMTPPFFKTFHETKKNPRGVRFYFNSSFETRAKIDLTFLESFCFRPVRELVFIAKNVYYLLVFQDICFVVRRSIYIYDRYKKLPKFSGLSTGEKKNQKIPFTLYLPHSVIVIFI